MAGGKIGIGFVEFYDISWVVDRRKKGLGREGS
jgi:hypothetical protein